jgi:hypothetical protein
MLMAMYESAMYDGGGGGGGGHAGMSDALLNAGSRSRGPPARTRAHPASWHGLL